MFFEMLTGGRPFVGRNLGALLMAIQTQPAPSLPSEHARYQPLLDRLLAKKPGERFQSAEALIEASAALLARP